MWVGGGEGGVGARKEGRTEETYGLESAFFGMPSRGAMSPTARRKKKRHQQGK